MNIALILSGGTGRRAGTDIPKQYVEVCGKPVLSYSIETLSAHGGIDAIQIVADPRWHERIKEWLGTADTGMKFRGFSLPGETRQLSVLQGLEDIRKYAGGSDRVLIHDGARPMLTAEMATACLTAAEGHGGVLPVLPMKDTVYYSGTGQNVDRLLKRECIYAGQAPETFRLGVYLEANRALLPERILEINGSTEPAILAGLDIAMIPGEECNYKITTMDDLRRFERENGGSR